MSRIDQNVFSGAVADIVQNAQASRTWREFLGRMLQSQTITGLLVILVGLLAERMRWDPVWVTTITGAVIAGVGRLKPSIQPITKAKKATVPLLLLLAACACVSGCQATAPQLYNRAARTEQVVLASVESYDRTAAAIGVSQEEKQKVLRQCKLVTDSLSALTDALKVEADAYLQARAAGKPDKADTATERAEMIWASFRLTAASAAKLMESLSQYEAAQAGK